MTNQEFINNLSPKAKEIISSYKPKDLSKYNIKVCLNDEHTRVNVSNPDAYIFEIKRQTSFYDMEYALLHEFYHCVQKDSGFPSTSQVDIKYQNISSYLSSIVLDCDVYDRLLKNGYKENPNILHKVFNEIQALFSISLQEKKYEDFLNTTDTRIFYAGRLLLLSRYYDKKDEVNKLIYFSKIHFPAIYNDYRIFSDAVQRYGFTSPKNVRKIFKTVIRELGIDELVKIV